MEPTRRAVIDIGTNSIKLLVADVAGHEVRPVLEESKQTRLGQGFYLTHRLQPQAIAATAQAVAAFSAAAREARAASIRVVATSAARDAVNPGELTSAIEQAAGVKVEIVSGDQEADWVFQGVTTDPALAQAPLLLLDVGGGSTEFILGRGEHKHFRGSFSLGTVRLLEKFPPSGPPKPEDLAALRLWLKEFLVKQVQPELEPAMRREVHGPQSTVHSPLSNVESLPTRRSLQLVGTGGTTSILARMEGRLERFDRERIEGTRLSLDRVRWHTEHLWSLRLEERKKIIGLPPNRADVILPGVAIYEAVMEQFGFAELRISTRGLRFAVVMDAAESPKVALGEGAHAA